MIIVASSNARVGIQQGMEILRAGGSAMDAVEAAIRLVEDNPEDNSVGYNSFPNILGELELDASIMNGATLESGAIAAMRNYREAISIARKVMETLPHVLLAGAGAERFAAEMGFEEQAEMLTEEMRNFREKRLRQDMSAEVFAELAERSDLHEWVKLATDPERTRGTVNVLAQDGQGNLCTGVSTSGWAWKYPGRVGDSPIIGAGNYADNRFGAAGCTGMGEMAIRASTAHSVIFYLKQGMSVEEAGIQAMQDLNDLGGKYVSVMSIVALDKDGTPAGFTSMKDRTYIYQTDDMDAYVELPRTYVEIRQRWN
jgi:beta-aspartyl-peptidase (threonine type)